MKNLAVINIGSNSAKMLISGKERRRITHTCQLARGMKGSLLAPDAIKRTYEAVRSLKESAEKANAEIICIYATEAVRKAENRDALLLPIERELGLKTEIADGETEAEYALVGVRARFNDLDSLLDVGGASTEFATTEGKVRLSLPVGAVKLTDLGGDRYAAASKALSPLLAYCGKVRHIYGAGGTFSTLAAAALGSDSFDAGKTDGYVLKKSVLTDLSKEIRNKSAEEITAAFPAVDLPRARVLYSGSQIIAAALDILELDSIRVSEADGLDGCLVLKSRE